jgi:hypothetical protein
MPSNLRNAAEARELQRAINDLRARLLAEARAKEASSASPAPRDNPKPKEHRRPTEKEGAGNPSSRSPLPEDLAPANAFEERTPKN